MTKALCLLALIATGVAVVVIETRGFLPVERRPWVDRR
ncbi:MAG: hypothetical protein QOH47_2453 [Sphingomonadales bacterium]|jgi:hypothetical protein|nr:hypothetical protein [Sphingomonadales bacterium]